MGVGARVGEGFLFNAEGTELQFWKMKKPWRWVMVMSAQRVTILNATRPHDGKFCLMYSSPQ